MNAKQEEKRKLERYRIAVSEAVPGVKFHRPHAAQFVALVLCANQEEARNEARSRFGPTAEAFKEVA